MRRSSTWLLVALGVVGWACGGRGSNFPGPAPVEPSARPAVKGDGPAPLAPATMPFAVHTRSRNGVTRLYDQLGDGLFVSAGNVVATQQQLTNLLVRFDDAHEVLTVGGRPDDFFAFVRAPAGRSVRRVRRGKVGPIAKLQGPEGYRAIAVDERGAFALVENRSAPQPYDKVRIDLVDEAVRPSGLAVAPQYCWTGIAARDGEVLIAGTACREGESSLVLQRFPKGEKVGKLDELPGPFPEKPRVTDVHLHAQKSGIFLTATLTPTGGLPRPYVAKWSGKEWKAVNVPEQFAEILSFSEAKDGTLFVVETQIAARASQVWRREASGTWRPVPLPRLRNLEQFVYSKLTGRYSETMPPQFVPLTVSAVSLEDVWVSASIEDGDDLIFSVLHKSAAPSLVEWPDQPPQGVPIEECKGTFFVGLGPLPTDQNGYAEVRQALKGHYEVDGLSLIETISGGRHIHGIFHTSQSSAARVMELLAKVEIKSQLRCSAPAATRVIPFKISTGELGAEPAPERHEPQEE